MNGFSIMIAQSIEFISRRIFMGAKIVIVVFICADLNVCAPIYSY